MYADLLWKASLPLPRKKEVREQTDNISGDVKGLVWLRVGVMQPDYEGLLLRSTRLGYYLSPTLLRD